jgi:hypothetical protein
MIKYGPNHGSVDHREANKYIVSHGKASPQFIGTPPWNKLIEPQFLSLMKHVFLLVSPKGYSSQTHKIF